MLGLLFLAGVATPLLLDSAGSPRERSGEQRTRPLRSPQSVSRQPAPASAGAIDAPVRTSAALTRLQARLLEADRTRCEVESDELRFLIWSLPAADYPAAWRLRERLEYANLRDAFQRLLVGFWAQLEPRAALAAALTADGR